MLFSRIVKNMVVIGTSTASGIKLNWVLLTDEQKEAILGRKLSKTAEQQSFVQVGSTTARAFRSIVAEATPLLSPDHAAVLEDYGIRHPQFEAHEMYTCDQFCKDVTMEYTISEFNDRDFFISISTKVALETGDPIYRMITPAPLDKIEENLSGVFDARLSGLNRQFGILGPRESPKQFLKALGCDERSRSCIINIVGHVPSNTILRSGPKRADPEAEYGDTLRKQVMGYLRANIFSHLGAGEWNVEKRPNKNAMKAFVDSLEKDAMRIASAIVDFPFTRICLERLMCGSIDALAADEFPHNGGSCPSNTIGGLTESFLGEKGVAMVLKKRSEENVAWYKTWLAKVIAYTAIGAFGGPHEILLYFLFRIISIAKDRPSSKMHTRFGDSIGQFECPHGRSEQQHKRQFGDVPLDIQNLSGLLSCKVFYINHHFRGECWGEDDDKAAAIAEATGVPEGPATKPHNPFTVPCYKLATQKYRISNGEVPISNLEASVIFNSLRAVAMHGDFFDLKQYVFEELRASIMFLEPRA